MAKRHIPNTNEVNDLRTAFGKIWDAIDVTANSTSSQAASVKTVASSAGAGAGMAVGGSSATATLGINRGSATTSTAVLATDVAGNAGVTLPKTADILSVSTSDPAWVRLYTSDAARTADASRLITVDPPTGAGITLDCLTEVGSLKITTSPVPTFSNNDTVVSTTGYLSVVNKDSVSHAITITIEYLPKEF